MRLRACSFPELTRPELPTYVTFFECAAPSRTLERASRFQPPAPPLFIHSFRASSFTRICRPIRTDGINPSRISRLVQLSEMANRRETLETRSSVRIEVANYDLSHGHPASCLRSGLHAHWLRPTYFTFFECSAP
jgi:hypothetical protein